MIDPLPPDESKRWFMAWLAIKSLQDNQDGIAEDADAFDRALQQLRALSNSDHEVMLVFLGLTNAAVRDLHPDDEERRRWLNTVLDELTRRASN